MKKVVKAQIISNRKIAPDHFVMKIESRYLSRASSPGQFVNVRVRNGTRYPLLRIPLGVHSIGQKGIELLYKVVGEATEILSARRRGGNLDVLGPLGNGYDLTALLGEKGSRAVLVAGGHGVAPLYGLAAVIRKKKKHVDLFVGACTKKEIVCAGKFRKLGVKVRMATEDGSTACKGYVTEPLEEYLGRNKDQVSSIKVFACGPRPMLKALAGTTKKHGVSAQVSLDAYMACGTGACLGCAIRTKNGYKMVCKDGPVFDAQEIVWEEA